MKIIENDLIFYRISDTLNKNTKKEKKEKSNLNFIEKNYDSIYFFNLKNLIFDVLPSKEVCSKSLETVYFRTREL